MEQYTAPVCEIQYLQSEGIICASGGEGSIPDWEDDGESLYFS